ncbi:MAG TPA: CYCXC family (seleno)protein [Terriglobales bacterium]
MKRLFSVFLLALVSVAVFGQGGNPAIPAYNKAAPLKGANLPPILPEDQLWGPSFQYPVQKRAYILAAKIGDVLYQQPCYCYCDRSVGHHSLRSCYESTHAAHCDACMKELFYAYQQTKAKKTPTQIRAGIIKGEWKSIDLNQAASIE